MNTLEIVIIMILLITIIKIITPLITRITTFSDEKLKFKSKVKKESIEKMTKLEFECFCRWLFEEIYHYKNVILAKDTDNGVNLILIDGNNEKTYVKCKKETDSSDFIIDNDICEQLVGSMVVNNISHGLIVTTSQISSSAHDYIKALKKNSDFDIKFLTLEEIIKILDECSESEGYSITIEV